MATLASPPSSSPSPRKRRTKSCARRCERACCNIVTYFPLAFVYGLTTWAVWVEVGVGLRQSKDAWAGLTTSFLGVLLYLLLNWSYSVAVFTDPGSPLDSRAGYSHLPTTEEPHEFTSFTVSSSGQARFCKKCQCRKPDRTHHCSTCKRCVLKMDHHCPWLATCLGLHNYKPFVLFLTYTSIFCWVCFWVTAEWCWSEVLNSGEYVESLMPINYVLLCVISGIIGLVLTGFTAWHLSLSARGMTTIECLEKTRYLSPIRKSMQRQSYIHDPNASTLQSYGQQFLEIHANTVPGVTRLEEGEERPSPVGSLSMPPPDLHQGSSERQTYASRERTRERDAYNDYLEEKDSQSLPNAFDMGWRQNMKHLFGLRALYWIFPVCNTTGDGWRWEASQKWIDAREGLQRVREERWAQQQEEDIGRQFPFQPRGSSRPSSGVAMSTLPSSREEGGTHEENGDYDYDEEDQYEISSDEADAERRRLVQRSDDGRNGGWGRQKVVGGGRKER